LVTDKLVRNIVEANFNDLNKHVVEKTKWRIIDIVGCMISGSRAPGNSIVLDLVKEWGGADEATILVYGTKVPAHNAAMANSIMARSFDFGVMQPYVHDQPVVAHVSETTVPTAIAMSERMQLGGKDLITALVVGNDLSARLEAASPTLTLGWCNTGTTNRFGATAIAGKLLGLNGRQMINAFGIVLNMVAGSMQTVADGTHSFKLNQGLSARDGIIAAELASKGWTGVKEPFLSKHGYFALYTRNFKSERIEEILTKDLGGKFYADEVFKPYPCCRVMHSAIDCALELTTSYKINAAEIDEVILNVSSGFHDSPQAQPFWIGDFPQGNANFNLCYNVANALVRGCVRLEHFTEDFIFDPLVIDLAKKVKIRATLPLSRMESAELKVKMKDGREFHAKVDSAKGNPIKKPLTEKEIEEKFRINITFSRAITGEKADEALFMLKNLEQLDNVAELIRLLIT
jgi:2-methylcitrate dehydratase PrpD